MLGILVAFYFLGFVIFINSVFLLIFIRGVLVVLLVVFLVRVKKELLVKLWNLFNYFSSFFFSRVIF